MQAIRPRADAIRVDQGLIVPCRARAALAGPSTRARAAAKQLQEAEGQAPCSSSSVDPQSSSSPSSSIGLQRRRDVISGSKHAGTSNTTSRRQALATTAVAAAAAALAVGVGAASPPRARAAEATTTTTTTAAPLEPFLDNDWSISYPRDYTYREDLSAPPQRDPSRPGGPAPARSPLRARFDAPPLPSSTAPAALLSVIVRQAQTLKPTIVQVADISAFGPPEEAARLLLPRGARLVAPAAQAQESLAPRETPLGTVEIPPVSYYYYEFVTPNGGERAVLAAAAARGKVYVAGGSAAAGEAWEAQRANLAAAVRSFRLRNQTALALEQVQQQTQKK